MKYIGNFKNIKEETIEVIIISENNDSEETELTFAGESPVRITQSSSEGIFTPIKSRSCTITIVSKDTYFDMYSGTSHGTSVVVNNSTRGECLFFGYLTPCEYNQPFIYLNEIELEAVDALSTLQDFKYEYQNGTSPETVTLASILRYCLVNVANYSGGIYITHLGLQMQVGWDRNFYPTKAESISEAAFFEDGEAMTCYEILEEICKFLNISAVPRGNDVYLVDYETVAKYGINYEWLGQDDYIGFVNILNDYYQSVSVPKTIEKDDYSGDDQNIELDAVYNKITVKPDILEIANEDLYIDPLTNVAKAAYIRRSGYTYTTHYYRKWRKYLFKTGEEESTSTYKIYDRTFYYTDKQINNKPTNRNWQCYANTNVWDEGSAILKIPCLHDTFSNQYANYIDIDQDVGMNMRLSRYEYQWCTINQQFGWKAGNTVPIKANWVPYVEFHTGIEAWYRYYSDINTGWNASDNTNFITTAAKMEQYGTTNLADLYYRMYDHELASKPVLEYNSDIYCNLTPGNSSRINYICFTGDLLWQKMGYYGTQSDNYHRIFFNNNFLDYLSFPIVDAGYSGDNVLMLTRNSDDSEYNQGWNVLKCCLQVGNKYWNGTNWTTSYSTFYIRYHKTNVDSGTQETMVFYDWNSPVTNHTLEDNINKDCFAIPITSSDAVEGKLKFQIFNPVTPISYMNGTSCDYMDFDTNIAVRINDCIPVIFMKDLSISVVSANNYGEDGLSWYDYNSETGESSSSDKEDVTYSNTISGNNVMEMDDLTLKINTYNDKVGIATSYLIQPNIQNGIIYNNYNRYHTEGFYNPHTNETARQEINIVNRYVEHYSSPKKIYNCQVHGYYDPWKCVMPNALDNIRMIVDEQDYDVKTDINYLKLVEY